MTPEEETTRALFASRSVGGRGLVLYDRVTALEFVEACRSAGLVISGVEGFELIGDHGVMPRMDLILDLSSMFQVPKSNLADAAAEEARRFLVAMPGESVVAADSSDVVMWDLTVHSAGPTTRSQ